jgi:methionyl-tRNA synthetase
MAAGLPLPKTVFAHGWLLFEQDKMSKSKGNVVYPEPLVEVLGTDALRYYLLRDVPFGQDSSFSYEGLIQRFNSDLANDLGNLASRTITMLNSYFAGEVPDPVAESGQEVILGLEPAEKETATLASETLNRYQDCFDAYDFSRALDAAWNLIARINKYLVENQPWTITREFDSASREWVTTGPENQKTVLYTAAASLRFLAVLLYPVLPRACQILWAQLGQSGRVEDERLDTLKFEDLKPGTKVGKPEIIFPRLEKEATLDKIRNLAGAERVPPPAAHQQAAAKEVTTRVEQQPDQKISIDDFAKVEMRVGEVVSAERVPGAQRLLKVMVDIGSEVRQVVAGIAEHYQPEDLIGMKLVVVSNLEPRKLRGVESNGMILAASAGEQGKPVLVTFKEEVPKGARLK